MTDEMNNQIPENAATQENAKPDVKETVTDMQMPEATLENEQEQIEEVFEFSDGIYMYTTKDLRKSKKREAELMGFEKGAFIRSVTIPEVVMFSGKEYKVTKIAKKAFCDEKITELFVSDVVETIGNAAFRGCQQLREVVIGKNVKSVGDHCFDENWNLTKIEIRTSGKIFADGNYCYKVIDTKKEEDRRVEIIGFEKGSFIRTVMIPERVMNNGLEYVVTRIGRKAFCNEEITHLMISDEIEEIDHAAFKDCQVLREVMIGRKVKRIEDFAFAGARSIAKLEVRTKKLNEEAIGSDAFERINAQIFAPKNKREEYSELFKLVCKNENLQILKLKNK